MHQQKIESVIDLGSQCNKFSIERPNWYFIKCECVCQLLYNSDD